MEKTIEIPVEFKRLFDGDWREAAIYGGRFSLKSHTVARYLLIRARKEKTRVACFREFQNSIAESSHHLLAELIKQYELIDFEVTNTSIINKLNGSDFIFKGLYHNEQNVKSTEGIDVAWVEEAQTVSKESLEVLTPTVRKDNSQIVYTYNRLLEDDPVHTRLIIEGRPNTLVINVNYDIAEKYGWMPKVIKKEIEDDKKSRPGLYKHKWLGEPQAEEIRIYKNWKIVDEIPHEARLERRGLDFGYSNDETAVIEVYYYNGGWILNERLYRKGMKNKPIADFLNNLEKPETLVMADSSEPKSVDEIASYGVNITGARKKKGGFGGEVGGPEKKWKKWAIQLIQDQPISITKQSTNMLKEYRNYMWMTDRNGKILNEPIDGNDHCMDAVRYALATLGRLKQELSYWDRIWEKELNPQLQAKFDKSL
uniref:Putative terminase n=1 Tax=viral metagenome TaxID=1070528 RepID=A0A6H1ZG34_9ZZZZ